MYIRIKNKPNQMRLKIVQGYTSVIRRSNPLTDVYSGAEWIPVKVAFAVVPGLGEDPLCHLHRSSDSTAVRRVRAASIDRQQLPHRLMFFRTSPLLGGRHAGCPASDSYQAKFILRTFRIHQGVCPLYVHQSMFEYAPHACSGGYPATRTAKRLLERPLWNG
jgi:hypothetical protein